MVTSGKRVSKSSYLNELTRLNLELKQTVKGPTHRAVKIFALREQREKLIGKSWNV